MGKRFTYDMERGLHPFTKARYAPVEFEIDERGCWICVSHSYHKKHHIYLKNRGKVINLRRYLYAQHKGAVGPDSRPVMTCGNPKCFNPDHMGFNTFGLSDNAKAYDAICLNCKNLVMCRGSSQTGVKVRCCQARIEGGKCMPLREVVERIVEMPKKCWMYDSMGHLAGGNAGGNYYDYTQEYIQELCRNFLGEVDDQ